MRAGPIRSPTVPGDTGRIRSRRSRSTCPRRSPATRMAACRCAMVAEPSRARRIGLPAASGGGVTRISAAPLRRAHWSAGSRAGIRRAAPPHSQRGAGSARKARRPARNSGSAGSQVSAVTAEPFAGGVRRRCLTDQPPGRSPKVDHEGFAVLRLTATSPRNPQPPRPIASSSAPQQRAAHARRRHRGGQVFHAGDHRPNQVPPLQHRIKQHRRHMQQDRHLNGGEVDGVHMREPVAPILLDLVGERALDVNLDCWRKARSRPGRQAEAA